MKDKGIGTNPRKKNPALSKFLMTLAATTVSIVLTFGTSAIIDRKKKNAEKREMVLMIMYDMKESLQGIEQCDSDIKAFFEKQVEAVAQPKQFETYYGELAIYIPMLTYSTTAETIFRSNVETIKTIGNILFVETVSEFYDYRERYSNEVVGVFVKEAQKALADYERLRDFDTDIYPFYGLAHIRRMKEDFEQCKLIMKVTDKDLDVFSSQQQKVREAASVNNPYDSDAAIEERMERKSRLQQARKEGEKSLAGAK